MTDYIDNSGEFYEAPIYAEFEAGARRARPPRRVNNNDLRNEAYEAQRASGRRIRIARTILNHLDFRDELKAWMPFVQDGIAARKSLGNIGITVFDTKQRPLRNPPEDSQEELRERLAIRCPQLYVATEPIKVTGIGFFGKDKQRPFVALTLDEGSAHTEQDQVTNFIGPELMLGTDHLNEHVPHVSLGQAYSLSSAAEIRKQLLPVIPKYVQFHPGTVEVTRLEV